MTIPVWKQKANKTLESLQFVMDSYDDFFITDPAEDAQKTIKLLVKHIETLEKKGVPRNPVLRKRKL